MEALHCPNCEGLLVQEGDRAHCNDCGQDFQLEARCPECHQPLEVLKACGSVDYFCRNGHGLISKKRVIFAPGAGA
jgi:uncharacterized protein YbaR (Trm112 family)